MNNNTDHVLDSPTTEFTFCLRGDEHLEKCTSGLFSSLPMHSRQTLWNRVFGEQFETSTANNTAKSTENKNASTLTALTVTSLLVIIIVITCLLLLIFIRWKRYKKKWTRDNEITIPLPADDLENVSPLLPLETWRKLSCNSHESTSTGYASDMSDSTRSSLESLKISQKKDAYCVARDSASPMLKRTSAIGGEKCAVEKGVDHSGSTNFTPVKLRKTQSYNVKKMNVIALQSPYKTSGQDDSPDNEADPLTVEVSTATANTEASPVIKRTSAIGEEECAVEEDVQHPRSSNDIPIKLRETQGYNVKKMNVIALQSPNKTPGQGDSPDNVGDPLTVEVSTATANSSDMDLKRLNWAKIFLFLKDQIFPSQLRLFFIPLLENAGCKNSEWHIQNIECSKKGQTEEIVFALLQLWKNGTWPNAKPKDIEDVFESNNWNAQLHAFREKMQNPPYLPEETNWNERSALKSTIGDTRQMEVPQIEGTDDTYGSITQTNDVENFSVDVTEHVSVVNEKETGVIRRKKFRCHRRMVQNKIGHDRNNKRLKAEEVECRSASVKESIKSCSHKHCKKRCEIVSKRGEHALLDTKVSSLSNKSCTSPHGSLSLSLCPTRTTITSNIFSPSSTYSSETYNNFSSGYGSMSSNSVEQNISTNTGNETNSQYGNAEANGQTGLLSNSVRNAEAYESQQEAPTNAHCQTTLESITENQNENLLLGSICQSTINSWKVSAEGRPSLTSSLVAEPRNRKQKRKINTKDTLRYNRKMVSKERQKCDRRKSTPCKKRRLSGGDNLKSAYTCTSSLIETFIIGDLLAKMTPSREDILSLKYHSFSTVNCVKTTWNEIIYILFSDKQSISVRQREWDIIQKYVNNARKAIKTKHHVDRERDFLFLDHNGEPLI